MKIRMGTVKSKMILALGHEGTTLKVQFVTGGTCSYSGVPHKVYAAFVRAKSKGTYFQTKIDGRYTYRCGE